MKQTFIDAYSMNKYYVQVSEFLPEHSFIWHVKDINSLKYYKIITYYAYYHEIC